MAQYARTGAEPRAVLFVDVVNSSRLFPLLGNEQVQSMLGEVPGMFAARTRANHGKVLKEMEHGSLCLFSSAAEAAAACQMHEKAARELPPAGRLTFGTLEVSGEVVEFRVF